MSWRNNNKRKHLTWTTKRSFRYFLCAAGLISVLGLTGCAMAVRKGAQKTEERDGPVGHLLNEVKEDIHPQSGSSADDKSQ